jgi:hypothetical protein
MLKFLEMTSLRKKHSRPSTRVWGIAGAAVFTRRDEISCLVKGAAERKWCLSVRRLGKMKTDREGPLSVVRVSF